MYGIDDFMERKRRNPMGTFDRLERALNLRVSGLKSNGSVLGFGKRKNWVHIIYGPYDIFFGSEIFDWNRYRPKYELDPKWPKMLCQRQFTQK